MPDYEKMYKKAFNALTEAEKLTAKAATLIQQAQLACEEIYIATTEDSQCQE